MSEVVNEPGAAGVKDEAWAQIARDTRTALALLGRRIESPCLPDELEPCGGTFALHAMADLAVIKAICDHQLAHLGPVFEAEAVEVYRRALAELQEGPH